MHKVSPWGSHLYLKVHRDKETTKGGQSTGQRGREEGAKVKGRIKGVGSCVHCCRREERGAGSTAGPVN